MKPFFIAADYKVETSLQKYEDTANGQLNVCGTSGTNKVSLFTDYLNPLTAQPAEQFSYLETYSTLFIDSNAGPVVFMNNTFQENMGILGGAITINNPDFSTNKTNAYNVI